MNAYANAYAARPLRSVMVLCLFLLSLGAGKDGGSAPASAPPDRPAMAPLPGAGKTTLTILSPTDNGEFSTNELLVEVSIELEKGASLTAIHAYVDGRLATQLRSFKVVKASTEAAQPGRIRHLITVPVPSADCALSLQAETSAGKSEPFVLRLRWKGAPSTKEQIDALQPRLYLLAIGVSAYRQPELRLRFAAKDARDLAAAFRSQHRSLYRSVDLKILTDEQATKNNILDGLEWLQRQATAKDVAVLFLAGHGVTDPGTGLYYFLPYDSDPEAVRRTMLPETEIRTTLTNIPGKVILFMDTCHSGKVFAAYGTRGQDDLSSLISELASADNGVVVFAASTGRQSSQESQEWNNGAFTKAAVEGLRGRADLKKNGRITLSMLDLYISERVKELTKGKQTPTTAKPSTLPDFPIAVARGLSNEDIELAR